MNRVEDYIESNSIQTLHTKDFIDEFRDEIKEMHGKCLDIGCGPGTTTRDLLLPCLPLDSQIIGLDKSKRMVDYAKTAHSNENRLSFIELDIEIDKLPYDQIGMYDNAISVYCLHWCKNLRRTFGNIYQLLRPGGKVLVLFIGRTYVYDAYLTLHRNPKYNPYMQDVQNYVSQFHFDDNPRASLKEILEKSGFKIHHCSFREKTFIYKNGRDLLKHMLAVNPFIERMPDNVRQQFEEDFEHELLIRMSSFENMDHEPKKERRLLELYGLFFAYFEKI